jgi:ATP-binding cassette subfamily B protein RaxB
MLAERRILQALASLNITRIVVAHRPAAIEGADRIYAVEAGRISELVREKPTEPLHVVSHQSADKPMAEDVE